MRPTVFLFGDYQQCIEDFITQRGPAEDVGRYKEACVQAGKLLQLARKLKQAGEPVTIAHTVLNERMGKVDDPSQYVAMAPEDGDDPVPMRKMVSQLAQIFQTKYGGKALINEHVTPEDNETILGRPTPNPFFDTTLTKDLRDLGAQRIVISGVSTSGVVLASVQAAFERGLATVVAEDACTDTADVHTSMIDYFKRRGKVIQVGSLHGEQDLVKAIED